MRISSRGLWRSLAIIALTAPLMTMSCVDLSQRAVINGIFDAATPITVDHLQEQWTKLFDEWNVCLVKH